MTAHRLLVAGTHSGVGKTTVALALMAALRARGLTVQPFKVGPDFIDPGHHSAVCGRTSRNLDTWMLPEAAVRATFERACTDADAVVIEGVMGLFDGRGADDWRGSSADVARLLEVPVVLVVDAAAQAASVAAVVKGFAEFDPRVRVVGVICNRVAGPRHYDYLAPAIRQYTNVVPLGWLPRREDWRIPERHLGLTTIEEHPRDWAYLGRALTETVDLELLLKLTQSSNRPAMTEIATPATQRERRVAVARDAAFCFYYPENLELLAGAGAELVFFSPLTDAALPSDTDLLYLGGGYPELHAARFSSNRPMLDSMRAYHRAGSTIYAECGGLMACCRELVDAEGRNWPMLDLLPARTVMQPRRAALGYVTLTTRQHSLLGPAGTVVRGHEFHYSRLEPLGPLHYAAELDDGRERRPDGLVAGNLYAGYAHLHFGSCPPAARTLLGR
ncbi:MAG: cobyrinate a,c-diamide synthase [Planctomycetia bacterium]|nr:cobyrinate a,c-diamide synthase [Planctomycetia bacterium]